VLAIEESTTVRHSTTIADDHYPAIEAILSGNGESIPTGFLVRQGGLLI